MKLAFAATVIVAGIWGCCCCGYGNGSFVDDPNTFVRALDMTQPDDVEVVQSFYWMSSHWTDEYCYYLEVLPDADSTFFDDLTSGSALTLLTDEEFKVPPDLIREVPEWFAPKLRTEYEVWTSPGSWSISKFGIMRDKEDGRLFIWGELL